MTDLTRCIGTAAYLGGVWALPEAFCWAWGEMREFNRDYLAGQFETIHYTRTLFSLHASARNQLVEEMHGDWLWMTDTDHVFEPDVLYKMVGLMQRYHVPILSGVYRHKALPHHPMLWHWDARVDGFVPIAEVDHQVPLFRVDAVGAGCLLVHRAVFDRLSTLFPNEGPFDHIGRHGEDMSFFVRCRTAGIPVHATPQVETIHLRPHGITADDYVPNWYTEEDAALAVPAAREG